MFAMEEGVSDDVLMRAVECVRSGGVLLYPTDTVYGLGGDPSDPATSERIRKLKGIDAHRPLLVLTDSWERVAGWIEEPDPITTALMEIATGESLTILFPARSSAPEAATGGSAEIGIRLCHHPFCRRLIEAADQPISSTSANRTGRPTPRRLADIEDHIRRGTDVQVDGGALGGLASTIVRVANARVQVVREGAFSTEALFRSLK